MGFEKSGFFFFKDNCKVQYCTVEQNAFFLLFLQMFNNKTKYLLRLQEICRKLNVFIFQMSSGKKIPFL